MLQNSQEEAKIQVGVEENHVQNASLEVHHPEMESKETDIVPMLSMDKPDTMKDLFDPMTDSIEENDQDFEQNAMSFGFDQVNEEQDEDEEDYQKISTNKIRKVTKTMRRNVAKIEEEIKISKDSNSDFRLDNWSIDPPIVSSVQPKTMGGPYTSFESLLNTGKEQAIHKSKIRIHDKYESTAQKPDVNLNRNGIPTYTREKVRLCWEYKYLNGNDYMSNRYRIRKWK